jgi:hypothetical protein
MDYLKQGIEIIKLDDKTATQVAKDEKSFAMAILFVALGGVASAIGMLNPIGIITGPIFTVGFFFVWIGILFLLARLFGGKGTYMELFRPAGIASVLTWVAVVPLLGVFLSMLASLWSIVVHIIIVRAVFKLSTGKAAAVVLIPIAVLFIIGIMIAAALMAFLATVGIGASQFSM